MNNNSKNFESGVSGLGILLIGLKTFVLSFLTLGIYAPWAIVNIRKYNLNSTKLNGKSFDYTASGKELLFGFAKVYISYVLVAAFYSRLMLAISGGEPTFMALSSFIFGLATICAVTYARYAGWRYKMAHTRYGEISFRVKEGEEKAFVKTYFINFLKSFVSIGLYRPYMVNNLLKFRTERLSFGEARFEYTGEGKSLFKMALLSVFLTPLTGGIYLFFYLRNHYKYVFENTWIVSADGKKSNFVFNGAGSDIAIRGVVSAAAWILTGGLAAPWIIANWSNYLLTNLELNGDFELEGVKPLEGQSETSATMAALDIAA